LNKIHENNRITSFLKVSERNNYDGKLISYNIAYTDNNENGMYTSFRIVSDNGKQSLTLISKGDEPRISPSSGRDLNSPIVVRELTKRSPNFNPWSN